MRDSENTLTAALRPKTTQKLQFLEHEISFHRVVQYYSYGIRMQQIWSDVDWSKWYAFIQTEARSM